MKSKCEEINKNTNKSNCNYEFLVTKVSFDPKFDLIS